MKIYIVCNNNVTKFVLPFKGEEFFSYTYNIPQTGNKCLITFEKKNETWYIKSNGVVNVYSGGYANSSLALADYDKCTLKVIGFSEDIYLYTAPLSNDLIYKLDIMSLQSLQIGRDASCCICYYKNNIAPIEATITKENERWKIKTAEDSENSLFINNVRITEEYLNVGDVLFIDGFKLVWMKNFILINNPNRAIRVTNMTPYTIGQDLDNSKTSAVTDEEQSVSLYTDDDYFYHTPRLQEVPEAEEIEIDPPPAAPDKENMPWLLTIGSSLTMSASALMMGWTTGKNLMDGTRSLIDSLPQLVMCVAMVFGSLIMPRVVSAYQKKQAKAKEKKRITKYSEYLSQKEQEIDLTLKKYAQVLRDNNLSAVDCKNIVLSQGNRNFWCREIKDEDFLRVRLGTGSINSPLKINAPRKQFTLEEDGLLEKVYEVVDKYKKVDNVPITVSLLEKKISAFICNGENKNKYLDSIILQLVTLHSGADLKIVVFTNEDNADRWEYMKFLPHCWSEDKTTRYFATNIEEAKDVSTSLEEEYKNRKELFDSNGRDTDEKIDKTSDYKNFSPYFLIICDNYKNNLGIPIIDTILKNTDINLGFSFTAFTNSMKNLPVQCDSFFEIGDKEGCVLARNVSSKNQQAFTIEYDDNLNMRVISNKLLNIPLLTKEGLDVLPTSLSFLEMYGVSKIEQLNILNRWKTNNPVMSLTAPIGVYANGEQFKLNLHEKFHGPHGLIAGSTGSGKSEFIITYILSMCVNYHPYEVQFVLIDYKGGGLAGAFQNKETNVKIPHLVGTITNLDTSEMNRTLVSIESELKRRQRVFNETKDALGESTIDIYKYQRLYREGAVKDPMSHLFIISDEFAELKSQQPEFMQQLISTARIGRSLGVHLILATQKPSGVVNDQIWSNSKFKVCLKVQDRGDSMEMLKRPEAASIKETGRFYLQVGYDDFFDKGQSGWAGAKYVPSDTILKKADDSISFLNNVGFVTRSIKDVVKTQTDTTNYGDQLTNIVKNIYDLGIKEDIHTKNLWLDAIPEEIFVENLKKKYNYKPEPYNITPVIGEYDKPASQEQGILTANLTEGNALIWGQAGAGKENLISTMIWSSVIEHTPQEVNFYIIDCGSESLKMFSKLPHVGCVCTSEDQEKIIDTFVMVDEELQSRKDLMADYGGSYAEYIRNSGKKLPLIVTIINNYEVFTESNGKLSESIQNFFRDGYKYGIVFIVSAISTAGVKQRMAQNFSNKYCLQIPNETEYRSVVNAPKGLFPAKFFGRGLVARDGSALEFQTALFCQRKDIAMVVKTAAEQLSKAYDYKAKPIASVPETVYVSNVKDELNGLENVPIGYSIDEKLPFTYNFTDSRITPILGAKFDNSKLNFVKCLIDMTKTIKDVDVHIVDFAQTYEGLYTDNYYSSDFDKVLTDLNNKLMSQKSEKKNLIFLMGAGLLKTKLGANGRAIINNIFNNLEKLNNTYFIFVDTYGSFKGLQTEIWYQTTIDNTTGIWIGEEVGNQMAININDLSLEDRKLNFPYMAFVVNKGRYRIIKHMVEDEEENNA